jgi:hypothetical protein
METDAAAGLESDDPNEGLQKMRAMVARFLTLSPPQKCSPMFGPTRVDYKNTCMSEARVLICNT